MYIKDVRCPRCGARCVVDGALWEVGTVRLRCPSCGHYFLPSGSPQSTTVQSVANASVDIEVWEPEEAT